MMSCSRRPNQRAVSVALAIAKERWSRFTSMSAFAKLGMAVLVPGRMEKQHLREREPLRQASGPTFVARARVRIRPGRHRGAAVVAGTKYWRALHWIFTPFVLKNLPDCRQHI